MNKLLTFSFIGGDLRQLKVASMLHSDGYRVNIYGFDNTDITIPDGIKIASAISECVEKSDVVILPMPYTTNGGTSINAPLSLNDIKTEDIVSSLCTTTRLFAGKADLRLTAICQKNNIQLFDYSEREELAIMNSIPTAEGAIEIAMHNTSYTLSGSKCLVIGYGRIGKILSSLLKSLDAQVTATARKYSDLAWIKANGCSVAPTSSIPDIIGDFDLVFNTVPSKILDFKALSSTKSDVLIIDLASRPGGVDFDVARDLNRHTIWALSLPGKVAPNTAGKIIKDTIINILEESGV